MQVLFFFIDPLINQTYIYHVMFDYLLDISLMALWWINENLSAVFTAWKLVWLAFSTIPN